MPVPATSGCYYMCFLDPCENTGGQNYQASITNPDFTGNTDGWALEGEAVFVDNSAVELGTSDYGFIYQADVFENYANQCVDIDIPFLTGQVVVLFGTATVATITTTGITRVCGIPEGNLSITIATSIDNGAYIESVSPVTVSPSNYVCNLKSNTFKIRDYSDSCTLLISATNNENGLGFVFGNPAFTPTIRLDAKLKGLKYPSERSIDEDSAGTKNVYYYSGRKVKTLVTDLQPEYVHDFLRLLLGFDNWTIDGVTYFVEDDEYNVIINDANDSVGSVKLLVSTRTQNVKSTNCS